MTEYEQVRWKIAGYFMAKSGYDSEDLTAEDWDKCVKSVAALLSLKHPNGNPMLLVGAQDQSRPELSAKGSWSDLWHGGYEMCQQDMSDFRRTLKGETG